MLGLASSEEVHQDVRATGLETLRQMVRAGTGITYLPFSKPVPKRTISLAWRKTSARIGLIEQLIGLIIAAHAKHKS